MQSVGTESALPTLEAILFDLKSTVQVKQIMSNALSEINSDDHKAMGERLMLGLEASSRAEFIVSVALAIEAIKIRCIASKPREQTSQAEPLQVDQINIAKQMKQQALGNTDMARGGPQAVQDALTIADLIAGGEREGVEFKSTLRTNLHTAQPDDKIQMASSEDRYRIPQCGRWNASHRRVGRREHCGIGCRRIPKRRQNEPASCEPNTRPYRRRVSALCPSRLRAA
jgi:hypothetical protein